MLRWSRFAQKITKYAKMSFIRENVAFTSGASKYELAETAESRLDKTRSDCTKLVLWSQWAVNMGLFLDTRISLGIPPKCCVFQSANCANTVPVQIRSLCKYGLGSWLSRDITDIKWWLSDLKWDHLIVDLGSNRLTILWGVYKTHDW